jgi:hypothetical protein
MPEQRKENDDWDGDPKQPKQNASAETHENLHFCRKNLHLVVWCKRGTK